MSLPLLFLVLSLATYRLTRLVVEDTFPPVLWARDRIAGGWREATESELQTPSQFRLQDQDGKTFRYVQRAGWSPQWLADLVSCAWCASGWISLGVVLGTDLVTSLPLPVLAWFAVWGAGALLASQEWA